MTEGEENIIIKGVLLEAISRDFSEELSNNKEVSVSPRFKRQNSDGEILRLSEVIVSFN